MGDGSSPMGDGSSPMGDGERGDRIKVLYRDGQGVCRYYKVLERDRFPWPSAGDGAIRLTSAQLAMLWEGEEGSGKAPVGRFPRRETGGGPTGGAASAGGVIYLPERPCFYGVWKRHLVSSSMSETGVDMPDDLAVPKALIAALQAENAKMSFAGPLEPVAC